VRDDAALATDLRTLDDRLERCHGLAELRFVRDEFGNTKVARLYQRTPCRVLFPRSEAEEPLGVVLLTTSGGITGGDRLEIAVYGETFISAPVEELRKPWATSLESGLHEEVTA